MKPILFGVILCITVSILTSCNQNASSISPNTTATFSTQSTTSEPTVQKTETATKTPLKPTWKELYTAELIKLIGTPSSKFNIYDLDGNGIPELLISEGDFHAAAGKIYTVNNEKIIDLGEYGSWGDFKYDPVSNVVPPILGPVCMLVKS